MLIYVHSNFSSTSNVDSVETEKSRIVLHELEENWWVLASIDLTRLPASRTSRDGNGNPSNTVEYSGREVAPAQLLIAQLKEANAVFLLHHATKLQDLFDRTGRATFCSLIEKYWDKFLTEWDVLLHGCPAVAIYHATKLSGGGELGMGVGEEEWGSGEREVLEGFIDRTEGLRDLIVGRYGPPPDQERAPTTSDARQQVNTWLGTGNDPAAADGIIFSGKGAISKRSLCSISKWMENIFKYGDDAYGIGENPSARHRAKRKAPKTQRKSSSDRVTASLEQEPHPKVKPPKKRAPNLRKRAIENNASPPGIPAPIVGQVERSLDQALAGAAKKTSGKDDTQKKDASDKLADESSSTFGTDNMMKYLTLGYGTSWTLNPKGLKAENKEPPSNSSQKNPSQPERTIDSEASVPSTDSLASFTASSDDTGLQEVEPAPEPNDDDKPFRQKLEQSIGKFLIGLSGDLEQTELDVDSEEESDTSEFRSTRLFMRTLMVTMRQPKHQERNPTIRTNSAESAVSTFSRLSASKQNKPPTSAEASIDGPQPHVTQEKVRLAVYVHQPFIFVFLFDLQTANLTMPSFYRSIHNQLGPLQKPLLRSTDPARVAERIASAIGERSVHSSTLNNSAQPNNPIYDLIYDSAKNTIRTSIPNIPVPGSPAAEGLTTNASSSLSVSGSWYTLGIPIGSSLDTASPSQSSENNLIKSSWSRVEALNAHTQILNTYLSTRSGKEFEHTAKTSRGWWVLWMKILPHQSQSHATATLKDSRRFSNAPSDLTTTSGGSNHKEAFLVRKAADYRPGVNTASRSVSTGPGRWLLREQPKNRDVSAMSGAGGAASAKGVSDGVGVDAKRWVEGLLSLS